MGGPNDTKGTIIHMGWLIKSPPKRKISKLHSWRKRFFKLRTYSGMNFLDYFKREDSKHFLKTVRLDECTQVDAGLNIAHEKFSAMYTFDIVTHKRTYFLIATTLKEMNEWVDIICKVCHLNSQDTELPPTPGLQKDFSPHFPSPAVSRPASIATAPSFHDPPPSSAATTVSPTSLSPTRRLDNYIPLADCCSTDTWLNGDLPTGSEVRGKRTSYETPPLPVRTQVDEIYDFPPGNPSPSSTLPRGGGKLGGRTGSRSPQGSSLLTRRAPHTELGTLLNINVPKPPPPSDPGHDPDEVYDIPRSLETDPVQSHYDVPTPTTLTPGRSDPYDIPKRRPTRVVSIRSTPTTASSVMEEVVIENREDDDPDELYNVPSNTPVADSNDPYMYVNGSAGALHRPQSATPPNPARPPKSETVRLMQTSNRRSAESYTPWFTTPGSSPLATSLSYSNVSTTFDESPSSSVDHPNDASFDGVYNIPDSENYGLTGTQRKRVVLQSLDMPVPVAQQQGQGPGSSTSRRHNYTNTTSYMNMKIPSQQQQQQQQCQPTTEGIYKNMDMGPRPAPRLSSPRCEYVHMSTDPDTPTNGPPPNDDNSTYTDMTLNINSAPKSWLGQPAPGSQPAGAPPVLRSLKPYRKQVSGIPGHIIDTEGSEDHLGCLPSPSSSTRTYTKFTFPSTNDNDHSTLIRRRDTGDSLQSTHSSQISVESSSSQESDQEASLAPVVKLIEYVELDTPVPCSITTPSSRSSPSLSSTSQQPGIVYTTVDPEKTKVFHNIMKEREKGYNNNK